jgi:plastocyanin
MRRTAVLALSGALLLVGCGGDDGSDTAAEAMPDEPAAEDATMEAEVKIASFLYLPEVVTIKAGGTVTWVNEDKAPHTSTLEEDRDQDTGRLDLSEEGSLTFDEPGTYRYYCIFHRFMEADVQVVE